MPTWWTGSPTAVRPLRTARSGCSPRQDPASISGSCPRPVFQQLGLPSHLGEGTRGVRSWAGAAAGCDGPVSGSALVGLVVPATAVTPAAVGTAASEADMATAAASDPVEVVPVDEQMAQEMADYYGISPELARDRVAGQRAAIELKESLPTSVAERWGGGVVDHAGGGQRRWFVTTEQARQEVETLATDRLGSGQVVVEIVDHTLAELETAMEQLAGELETNGVVVTDVAVDVERNGLSVGVPASAEAYSEHADAASQVLELPVATSWADNVQQAQASLGGFEDTTGITIVERLETESRVGVDTGCTSAEVINGVHRTLHCDDPLRGGPTIFRSSCATTFCYEANCSAGFQVRSTEDNALYLFTAGHCARPGTHNGTADRGRPWFTHMPRTGYGNHWIGNWWRSVNNSGDGDGGIMTIDNQSGWGAGLPLVYVHTSFSSGKDTTLNEFYVIGSRGVWSTLDTNDWLCKTGGKDWTDCGRYLGADTVTIAGISHTVRVFDTMRNCAGDSGGPVLGNNRGWGIAKGATSSANTKDWSSGGGISRTGAQCYHDTYVMALERPLEALNVRLVTVEDP
jgi:hypothetical protein